MDETSKKTIKDSADEQKNGSRVVDMSWAAEYIDDDWESNFTSMGNYNTRVTTPSAGSSVMFDLMADSMKGLEAGVNGEGSEMAESIGMKTSTEGLDLPDSPMAATQEYKAVKTDSEFSRQLRAAIAELESKDAKILEQMADEQKTEETDKEFQEDLDDILKIRDAATDKTIYSVEDAKRVRQAASEMDLCDDLEDIAKIRDAQTDKTIVSLEDAKMVREAASMIEMPEDLDDIVKIRDAATDKTIFSVDDAKQVREAEKLFAVEKIRDAATDNTIVSIEDAKLVRDAAAESDAESAQNLENTVIFSKDDLVKTQKSEKKKEKRRKNKKDKKKKEDASQSKITEINVEDLIEAEADEQPFVPEIADDLAEEFIRETKSEKRRPEKRSSKADSYSDDYFEAASFEDDSFENDYYEDEYYEEDDYDRAEDIRRRPERRRRYNEAYYVEARSPFRFVPLFLVIALCVFAFITAREVCFDNPVNSSDYSKVVYTISGPIDTETLAADLHSLGLIDNPLVFRLRCLFYDLDCKDGTYELSPCYSTEKIVNILSGYEYIDE